MNRKVERTITIAATPERVFQAWLEAMNSLGWLEGYGGHEAFHYLQIDKVIAQLDEHNIK